jgi:hypothetical protein
VIITKVRYYDERFKDECSGYIVDNEFHIAEQCGWEQYCSSCDGLIPWPCPIAEEYEKENNAK